MSTLSLETRKKLIEKRIIPINGKVSQELFYSVEDIMSELLLIGSPDIALIINSSGGDVLFGLNVFDLVRNYPGKTTGIVIGRAASMAVVILQACDRRICANHGEILIHHISRNTVSLDVLDDPTGEKYRELRSDMIKRQQFINTILVDRTKKSLDEVKAECLKDKFMTAQEAKDFKLIDEILIREEMAKWFKPTTLV